MYRYQNIRSLKELCYKTLNQSYLNSKLISEANRCQNELRRVTDHTIDYSHSLITYWRNYVLHNIARNLFEGITINETYYPWSDLSKIEFISPTIISYTVKDCESQAYTIHIKVGDTQIVVFLCYVELNLDEFEKYFVKPELNSTQLCKDYNGYSSERKVQNSLEVIKSFTDTLSQSIIEEKESVESDFYNALLSSFEKHSSFEDSSKRPLKFKKFINLNNVVFDTELGEDIMPLYKVYYKGHNLATYVKEFVQTSLGIG